MSNKHDKSAQCAKKISKALKRVNKVMDTMRGLKLKDDDSLWFYERAISALVHVEAFLRKQKKNTDVVKEVSK